MTEEQSEFGAGMVLCLVKFAEHFENRWAMQIYNVHAMRGHLDDPKYLANYGRDVVDNVTYFNTVERKISGSTEAGLNNLITSWANGASDHLYQIKAPDKWKNTPLGQLITDIRDTGLDMGHGAGLMGERSYTFEDFATLKKNTRQAAHMLDKLIWAEAGEETQLDIGQW